MEIYESISVLGCLIDAISAMLNHTNQMHMKFRSRVTVGLDWVFVDIGWQERQDSKNPVLLIAT